MGGRWVNNCWLTDNDLMENLTAERWHLTNQIRAIEMKIDALKHEQYLEFKEFLKK